MKINNSILSDDGWFDMNSLLNIKWVEIKGLNFFVRGKSISIPKEDIPKLKKWLIEYEMNNG